MEDVVLNNEEDRCIWIVSNNGCFSTKSTYNLIRPKGVQRPALTKIWHNCFHRRASLFVWKILHRVVPVDGRISEAGIPLVSRCSCCQRPHSEDLDHLFIHGEIATTLWRWIHPMLPPKATLHSHITSHLWSIIQNSNIRTPSGFVSLFSLTLMLWEIWKGRCLRRFENTQVSVGVIISTIKSATHHILSNLQFKSTPNHKELQILHNFRYAPKCPAKLLKLIRWLPPIHDFSLNVDGACKGNPGSVEVAVAFVTLWDESMLLSLIIMGRGQRGVVTFYSSSGVGENVPSTGNPPPFKVTKASQVEFPALNGQSVSMAILQYAPGGINALHTHPRFAELLVVVKGWLEVGFVDSANKLFVQTP
ncbi:hypothetical protein Taro_028735 [Colocasia esculenta]|uniref:Uncharacterized protein n=1 Tax=Colocasia esculenta TaxID=4460 RepID=A0A843VH70_COLES|nr:hypothetical protein [Colocasia esculenta]